MSPKSRGRPAKKKPAVRRPRPGTAGGPSYVEHMRANLRALGFDTDDVEQLQIGMMLCNATSWAARIAMTEGTPLLDQALTLLISLRGVQPEIWREIVVPGSLDLSELSWVLLDTMGWEGYHLHVYDIGGELYGDMDSDDAEDSDFLDEADLKLSDVVKAVGHGFRYDYDFGDGWEHDVTLTVIDPDDYLVVPGCMAGARACPPEDCGGPDGYAHLLEVLADPTHREHAELSAWAPEGFDSEWFRTDDVNSVLLNPRRM